MTTQPTAKTVPPRSGDGGATITFLVPPEGPSLHFAAVGVYVDKAVLGAVGCPLSILRPQYEERVEEGAGSKAAVAPAADLVTELPFFGEKPFHAALVRNLGIQLTLTYTGPRVPSLRVTPVDGPTWESLGAVELAESVTAGSDNGPVTRTLVYRPHECGYKA